MPVSFCWVYTSTSQKMSPTKGWLYPPQNGWYIMIYLYLCIYIYAHKNVTPRKMVAWCRSESFSHYIHPWRTSEFVVDPIILGFVRGVWNALYTYIYTYIYVHTALQYFNSLEYLHYIYVYMCMSYSLFLYYIQFALYMCILYSCLFNSAFQHGWTISTPVKFTRTPP